MNPELEDTITLRLKQSAPNMPLLRALSLCPLDSLPLSSVLPWVAFPGTLAHISGACGLGIAISQLQQGLESLLQL